MGKRLTVILVAGLLLWGAAAEGKGKREICITFDELPASASFDSASAAEVMWPLLEALKKHEVKAAGFVVGQHLEGAFDMLGQWLNDGHRLGDMTYAQTDLHEVEGVSIEAFIADLIAGRDAIEPMLEGFGQERRYFRYPFLHYGTTVEAQRAVQMYLEEHAIQVGHASVVVDDYLYNLGLQKMGGEPSGKQYEQMMNEYVNHVLDQVEAAEMVSMDVVGRNCRQILQLRANRLNALFLDMILTQLEGMGYTFISIDKALQDDVYTKPHAYFGSRGVGYLEMLERSDPDLLPAGE